MFKERKLTRLLAIAVTLAMYSFMTQSVAARGGGHGGGHGGGGHHASHHGGEHNHHPYHPSHHHEEHHASHHGDHHHVAHHNHHHENWHHGGWGPGFWGGAALGYGYAGWDGYGYGGGDTYVDNSTNVTPASNESAGDDDANASDDSADSSADSSDGENTAANDGADKGFPTDDWPELGVVTYAGEYGASQGQVIVRVVPGSAAAKAGLVPGDVILTFNGQPVPSADDLDTAFDAANGKFEASVWDARTGRKSTISGALDPAAAPPTNETTAFAPAQQ